MLRARDALRSGDCKGALAPLREARRRFPGGILAQERDALWVEALARSGRSAEASDRARAFLREYPISPYADLVRREVR